MRRSRPRDCRTSTLLVVSLLLAWVPVTGPAAASHEIPLVLDEHDVQADGGYVAWRIQIDSPNGWADVYQHYGEHLGTTATGANYTHLGVWMANLDHGYVWQAVTSSFESDGADVHVQTTAPVTADHHAAIGGKWDGANGGHLPMKNGEWLVVVFWATDGRIQSQLTLGSEIEDGDPSVSLVNKTSGTDVFAFENGDFGGDLAAHSSANAENACAAPICGPARGADARVIRGGEAATSIDHRLFGSFFVPGQETNASWTGPAGEGRGQDLYWFHGSRAGTYDFSIERNTAVHPDRRPAVAVGADVQIPLGGPDS